MAGKEPLPKVQTFDPDADIVWPKENTDDLVSVYRLTPITSAKSEAVLGAIQTWWNELPATYDTVNEHLTWQLDGCTFDLKITSND